VQQDPNLDVAHTIQGLVKLLSGDPIGALRSTSQALRLNPKIPSADLSAIADINHMAGRTAVAVELWERARAANPDLIPARVQLAAVYESQGRHDEAQILIKEILRVNPEITTDVLSSRVLTAGLDADAQAEIRDRLRAAGLP
jgi:tetratricopeptide (TPR) repeat protein